jgi:hypothetical protein
LANPSDSSFFLSTSVPSGTETADAPRTPTQSATTRGTARQPGR